MRHALRCLIPCCLLAACAPTMPQVDLKQFDPGLLARCRAHGVIVLADERYEDYWARNYDNYKVRLLRQMGSATDQMTIPDAVRRRVLRIVDEQGAEKVATFAVVHYQEATPPVRVYAWTEDGRSRGMNVEEMGTRPLVDWPCRSGYPRQTAFRIGPLNPGDTIEIRYPLSGPEQELWRFADERFCTLRSRAVFGHPHDSGSTRLDMDAVLYDGTGRVERSSPAGVSPVVYELQQPLPPLPAEQVPFVARASRCRGFEYLNGRVFHTPLWMARDGDIEASIAPAGGDAGGPLPAGRRIAAVGRYIAGLRVDPADVPFWMRWLPREPAHRVAARGHGSAGGIAALAFRLLEEAGLEPRYALVHTDRDLPFARDFASPILFDTLAVVVADAGGRDRWLVPGAEFAVETPIPALVRHRKALVMKRWLAERITGGGACWPAFDTLHACFNASKALDTMDLITVGHGAG